MLYYGCGMCPSYICYWTWLDFVAMVFLICDNFLDMAQSSMGIYLLLIDKWIAQNMGSDVGHSHIMHGRKCHPPQNDIGKYIMFDCAVQMDILLTSNFNVHKSYGHELQLASCCNFHISYPLLWLLYIVLHVYIGLVCLSWASPSMLTYLPNKIYPIKNKCIVNCTHSANILVAHYKLALPIWFVPNYAFFNDPCQCRSHDIICSQSGITKIKLYIFNP